MFGLLSMIGNYEQRLVENTKVGKAVIDTVAVTDSTKPFETAVKHPSYNDGEWVIVELYDTKGKAKTGHKKWVGIFSKKNLPSSLRDVSRAGIMRPALAVGGKSVERNFKKPERRIDGK